MLGTIGYLRYTKADYGFLDALYRSIGLFGLGGTVDPPVPPTLQIARVMAPLITGYAAIRGLIALSREQLSLAAVRLFARDHVVIAGLGEMGFRLTTAFDAADYRIVAIELDPTARHVAGVRERGVTVVVGNAADPAILRRTGASRAQHILLTCGDDGTNVDASAAAARLVPDRRSGVLTAFVHLDDLELWRALSAEAVAAGDREGIRLEFFNAFATAARLMVERHPPFPAAGDGPRRPHVLLVGLEGVGEQLVLHIAGAWRASSPGPADELRLTVTGPRAREDVAMLLDRYPALAHTCRMEARPLELDSGPFREGAAMADGGGTLDVSFAYVCLLSDSSAMAAALALHARGDSREVPVVVTVVDAGDGVGRALAADGGRLHAIEPFGVFEQALSPALLLGGITELLARAKHEQYVRSEEAKGDTAQSNPSMVPWDELPESLQESNRRFADGIGRKLRETGCAVVPVPLGDGSAPGFAFEPAEVEELARAEHDRWMNDLIRDGWTAGEKRDPVNRVHPLLVPWEKLSEPEREKDREPVRELPDMLARAGLRVYRTRRSAS